jgi:hypothetical protein
MTRHLEPHTEPIEHGYKADMARKVSFNYSRIITSNEVDYDGESIHVGRELTPKELSTYNAALDWLEKYFDWKEPARDNRNDRPEPA